MTAFGNPGNLGSQAPYDGLTGAIRRIEDLERTVKSMQTLLVSQGSVVTVDGSGNQISLNHLGFGIDGANDGAVGFQQNTFDVWSQGPMSLTVTVTTGRLLVIASAVIGTQPTGSTSQGWMSWALSGPTNVAQDLNRALFAGTIVFGACYAYLHTGLTNGTYTITDWYQSHQTAGPPGPIFTDRSLVAIPL